MPKPKAKTPYAPLAGYYAPDVSPALRAEIEAVIAEHIGDA